MTKTATPAPASQTTCCLFRRGEPGADLNNSCIFPLTEISMQLEATLVASGAPTPLTRTLGFQLLLVF